VRLFVVDEDDWSELTDGGQQPVRVVASDLQQARRIRARMQADHHDGVAVILDVTVAVAGDFRSARTALEESGDGPESTLRYVGTLDGLVGLIADIESAGVADGVTLLAGTPRQDLGALGRDVLGRLAIRDQARAS
jgi:hypothetical protein